MMRLGKLGTASVSLFALACSVAAYAQESTGGAQTSNASGQPPEAGGPAQPGIQDIVVTATRQATNLQDTPIAITAVTAEALEVQGLRNVADLSAVVPNAQFRRVQGAFGPGVTTFIRGIGTGDTSLGGEAAVAYYIDDVYYPILLGSNFDLLDIDHIEVLRGPQGTLFGRNSLAGAVNIVSKQPRLGETSGYAEVTAGSFDRRDLRAGINVPLGDTAALMISGLSRKRTGYMKMLDFRCEMERRGTPALAGNFPYFDQQLSATPNFKPKNCVIGHLGGDDVRALRGSIQWEPTSDITLTLSGDHIWDDSENPADSTVDLIPANVTANIATQAAYWGLTYDTRFLTGDPFTTYASYVDRIQPGQVIPGNTFYNGRLTRGGLIMDPVTHLKNWGLSAKLVWSLSDDIDLTIVAGHRDMQEDHSFDTDSSPLAIEHVQSDIGNKYDNLEVRLSGTSDLVDWVVGAFYFDAFGYFHATNYSPVAASVKTLVTTYEPNSKAAFANATVRPFGERLGIVLGARYSKDHKFVDYSNLTDVPPHPNPGDTIFQVDPKQEVFSWKLGANYQIGNEALLYASAATGNSLPGYNARPLQASQVAQYDGNDSIAYEVGAKLDLLDRRVRLNLAGFYTDFKNRPTGIGGAEALIDANTGLPAIGSQALVPLPGGPAGSTRCAPTTVAPGTGIVCLGRTYYVNQPATIWGFEAEYTLNPLDPLTINGSVGYSKFDSYDIDARLVNRRQNYPFWTANAGIQYEIPVNALQGTITPRLDWSFQSSEVVSGTSTKYNELNEARSIFNTRVTYDNEEYDFSLAAGVTNLFDKFYYWNFFDYQGLGRPNTQAQPGQPRQWYLTLSKQF
jgi:iron complex outermembrane receptor protein